MIYTIEKANLISSQLRRFTTGYAHHVVGQFANIDFWLQEVVDAQTTIDRYKYRFINIRDAQKDWVEMHNTRIFNYCPICRGKCEFGDEKPLPPKRMSSSELDKVRRALVDAMYYFLVRCYRMGLLNFETLKEKCDYIGTGIDPYDLEK